MCPLPSISEYLTDTGYVWADAASGGTSLSLSNSGRKTAPGRLGNVAATSAGTRTSDLVFKLT